MDGSLPLEPFQDGDIDRIVHLFADIDEQIDDPIYSDGKRPIHLAVWYCHIHLVQFFLDHGADINKADHSGHTALHLAALQGCGDIVALLLRYGADVSAQNKIHRQIPLHLAVNKRHTPVVELLLQAGSNVNQAEGKERLTPLHQSVKKGDIELTWTLLEHGADVNAAGLAGWTALHYAADGKHSELVALLLKFGADPNAQTRFKWNPLHLAAQNGDVVAVRMLMQAGADPKTETVENKSAVNLAVANKQALVVPLLAGYGSRKSLLSHSSQDMDEGFLKGRHSSQFPSLQPIKDHEVLATTSALQLPPAMAELDTINQASSEAASCMFCCDRVDPSEPPGLFLDPTTGELMEDPVVAYDGYTYERGTIQEWFDDGHRTSPLTQEPVRNTHLIPNLSIKAAIKEWEERQRRQVRRTQTIQLVTSMSLAKTRRQSK